MNIIVPVGFAGPTPSTNKIRSRIDSLFGLFLRKAQDILGLRFRLELRLNWP